jgi:hypothetical protein
MDVQEDGCRQQHPKEGQAMEAAAVDGGGPSIGKVHSQPEKYTLPPKLAVSDTLHSDLLGVAAACGALVNVHPDVVMRQVSVLQHRLLDVEKVCAPGKQHAPASTEDMSDDAE